MMPCINKIILLGEKDVGKSALLDRFVSGQFAELYTQTIGINFETKCITLDGCTVKCQLWEFSGHSMHVSPRYFMCQLLRSLMSTGNVGIMVVYDVNNASSLESVDYYLGMLHDIKKKLKVSVMLVGNKCDGKEDRNDKDVDHECVKKYLDDSSCDIFVETSAKYGYNVEQAFVSLIAMCQEKSDYLNDKPAVLSSKKIASSRIRIGCFDGCTVQ